MAGTTMEPYQSPGTPSTPSNDPPCSPQAASTDTRPFQSGGFGEYLLNLFPPSHGTSEMFQGYRVPGPSYQAPTHHPLPGWNGTTANMPSILPTNTDWDQFRPGTLPQFQHVNASQPLGALVGQSQTIHPLLATDIPPHGWQQTTSLLQNSQGPPQSQERSESGLLGISPRVNTSFGPPPAVSTADLAREPVDESEPQATALPPSAVQGIELESPRPADGETAVRVRRDSCVTLSFDLQSLFDGSTTYNALKIPRTHWVRSQGSERGMKLFRLQIRVLGATTKAPYETLCPKCKKREKDWDAFPDFRAASDIIEQKDGKVLVSFTLNCCSNHRGPNDSEYCLEVVLYGGAEQNNPFIQYELPYSFSIVPKVPKRTRTLPEDVVVDAVVPPPSKRPRRCSGRVDRVGNPASQSVGPSGVEELSARYPTGPTNETLSGTRRCPGPFVDNHRPASPAEASIPPRQHHQAVNAANDEAADGQGVVVERVNPKQGPTTGGPEIWISGSNFPTDLRPLYVRFGGNATRASVQMPGLLSCFLPPADVPGKVKVVLSRSSDPKAPALGTSICQFEYVTDLNEMMPIMIRIQEDCTPEVAAALDVLHKEMKNRNLKRNGGRPPCGGEARHDEIETAIIQALVPLQNTQGFGEVISKTNDHKQTLAHFAVHFGYTTLLRQLVEWNIDLSVADVNGFTALHCAYKKGDRVCVDLLLEKGASETVVDALGRAPSQLMPEAIASLDDHDTETASDDQLELGQRRDVLSLLHSTDSWDGASDSGGERSMEKAVLADPLHQSQSSSAASNSQSTLCSVPLPVHSPTVTLAPMRLPVPKSTPTLDVNIISPKYTGSSFPYRHHVTARLTLTGMAIQQLNQVVLGLNTPTSYQPVVLCYAECRSCTLSASPQTQCNPIRWYLDQVRDRSDNLDFMLEPLSGALTGNVTFSIPSRARRPRPEDQTWRCRAESLMLTFLLCDCIGQVVVKKQVGPFRARTHMKRDRPPQQYADGPHHLRSGSVQPAVPSLPNCAQTSSYMSPVGCSAPEVLDRHLFPEDIKAKFKDLEDIKVEVKDLEDIKAEFKDPEEILAKGHFDIGYGGW